MRKIMMMILAAAALAAASATIATTTPTALAAEAKLDRSFGRHHGYWVRMDGPWAKPAFVSAVADGTALVATDDGRFLRIGAEGRPDGEWGTGGVVDLGPDLRDGVQPVSGVATNDAVRWKGRYLLSASGYRGPRELAQVARVVDARGRTLPGPTAAVRAAMPPVDAGPGAFYDDERLAPAPDGRLWDLRVRVTDGPEVADEASLSVLDAAGAPLAPGRVAVSLPGLLSAPTPATTRKGLLVVTSGLGGSDPTLHRVGADGALDAGFHPVALAPFAYVEQMLPWAGGAAVVTTGDGRARWIADDGTVVRERKLPLRSRVALDAEGRAVVVSGRPDGSSVTVRRLRRDGTSDPSFGVLALRAPGRQVDVVGLVVAPGGRLLVVGRSYAQHLPVTSGAVNLPKATVVWRVTTR